MIDILIDRVGNVNVFNILNSGQYYSEANIQSAIDSDLISEYVKEIINLSKLSNQISGNQNKNFEIKPEILQDLKNISETFYEQFFPESISKKLKSTNEKFLHFSIDNSLSDIPWELLYDGECFLSDRFYIGRTVKGTKANTSLNTSNHLKMLIIADPTEDLEWAQKEGELIFRTLKEKISPSKLHIEFIAGKQITKLKLLSLIRDKHIIHYAGHLFFSDDPLENGWLLSEEKVLKAREIKNSAFSTNLIFSNSCNSSKSANLKMDNADLIHDFASSFLLSGIKNFIGTKWEVVDNDKTIDFTIRFYLSLFSDKTIGESLSIAREFARKNYGTLDLTWANYSQYGNPSDSILTKQAYSKTKIIDPEEIKKNYPTPIAYTYSKFMELSLDISIYERLKALVYSFQSFSFFMSYIILNEHKGRDLNLHLVNEKVETLRGVWDLIFHCITDFKKLQLSMFIESMTNVFFSNREFIFKIINWFDKFDKAELSEESLEGYLVTSEYYFENLLVELSEIEKFQFIYYPKDKNEFIILTGIKPEILKKNSNQTRYNSLDKLSEYILLNTSKNSILNLNPISLDYFSNKENLSLNYYLNFLLE